MSNSIIEIQDALAASVTTEGDTPFAIVEVGSTKYGVELSTQSEDDLSELTLYGILEDGEVGKSIATVTNHEGHCGVTLGFNGDLKDVRGVSFKDMQALMFILEVVYKDKPVQFLYI